MRLTMRTNLAMRTLMFCAVNEGRIVRKVEVAAACDASENHLAQVIHKLAQAGFIRTLRGRTGGLQLRQTAATIRVGDVVRAFEAGLPFTQCLGGHESVTGAKLRATWPAMRLWRCVYCLLKLGSVGGRFGQGVVRAGLR